MYVPKLEIPSAARYKTLSGLTSAFYKAQKDVLLAGIDDKKLPFFARKYLKNFFEVTEGDVRGAILDGDPWFFLSWRARLAQVDEAVIESGGQITERWSLIRAQHILDLFQMVANKRLVALGGRATNGQTPPPAR